MRRRRLLRSAGCALAIVAAGCRVGGVEPLPLAGPPPERIAIWPLADGAEPPADELWFTGLVAGIGARGYRIVPPGVVTELLRGADAVLLSDDNRIGRKLRADALLFVTVHAFEADGESLLQSARWDVSWRLESTRGHGTQWTFRHNGSWQRADREVYDPSRSLDPQQDPGELVPIGGNGNPGFRDPRELLAHLNRLAADHLPAK